MFEITPGIVFEIVFEIKFCESYLRKMIFEKLVIVFRCIIKG